MPKTLIESNPRFTRGRGKNDIYLFISEMFSDTIQGEGISMGVNSVFIRFMDCTLNCTWCDSKSVWRFGNPYSIGEIFEIWEQNGVIDKFKEGHHLILTGGSPLRQQIQIISLIERFIEKYGFKPYIEIENEAVLPVHEKMVNFIDQYNNSPKLESSGNTTRARFKEQVLRELSSYDNSWFKFVITDDLDWNEIKRDFLDPGIIRKDQIILMPEGETKEALENTRQLTVNIALREGVKYSDRLQVLIWGLVTGV